MFLMRFTVRLVTPINSFFELNPHIFFKIMLMLQPLKSSLSNFCGKLSVNVKIIFF